MNYEQFLASIGATLAIKPVDTGLCEWVTAEETSFTNKCDCTLAREGRSFSFPFFGKDVDVEIVAECIADLACLTDGKSFAEWQGVWYGKIAQKTAGGYHEEITSRDAYQEALELVVHLKRVLGDAYKAFLALDPYAPGGAS